MSDDEDFNMPVLHFGKGFSRNWNDLDLRKNTEDERFCESQLALSDNLHEQNNEQLVEEDEIGQVPSFYSQDKDIVCEEPEENEVFDEEKTWKHSLLRKRISRDNYEDYFNESKQEEEKQVPVKNQKEETTSYSNLMSVGSNDVKQQLSLSLGLESLKEKIGKPLD